jgi:hypothetical protein
LLVGLVGEEVVPLLDPLLLEPKPLLLDPNPLLLEPNPILLEPNPLLLEPNPLLLDPNPLLLLEPKLLPEPKVLLEPVGEVALVPPEAMLLAAPRFAAPWLLSKTNSHLL